MERRGFLKHMAYGAGAVTAGWMALQSSKSMAQTREGDMIFRTLGRTGEKVSLLGLGGYHIGIQPDEADSIRIIRTAMDHGVNFLDNCWDYNKGQSEIRMGKALRDGYRDKAFLMSKIDGRKKEAAARQIDESLQRLQTDCIDLMQIHEVIRFEDPYRLFNEGCIEALQDAQKAGKIRYIGFTGHKDPLIHLRMLEVADARGLRFDAVQMPLNVMDAHFHSFEKHVLPELVTREIGVIGMKPLGNGDILKSNIVSPMECLHYAMSLPTSVVLTGMDTMERVDQALKAVREFHPMDESQAAELLARTRDAAADGRHERFKTTAVFDGTAHHPEWMG